MPEIRPYDPTDVKNMVVGVADYRKAKAGEAFENLARGLGEVRNQVASNAEQRIAMNTGLASEAIGSVAHLLQHTKAVNQTQKILNQQKVAQIASNFNLAAGNAARALQNGPGASDPATTNQTFSNALSSKKLGPDGNPIVNYNGEPADISSIMAQARQDPDLSKDGVALAQLSTQLTTHANTHRAEMDNWKYNARTAQAGQANQGFTNDGVKIVSDPVGIPATDTGTMSGTILDQTKAITKNSQTVGMTPDAIRLEVQKANQKISYSGFDAQIGAQAKADDAEAAITNLETISKTIDNRGNLGFDLTPESALTLQGKIESTINAQAKNLDMAQNARLTQFRTDLAALDVWRQDEGQRDDIGSQQHAFNEVKKADVKLTGLVNELQQSNASPRAKDVILNRLNTEREGIARRMSAISGRIEEINNKKIAEQHHKEVLARQAIAEQKADAREARRIQNEKEAEADKIKMEQRQEALAQGFSIKEQMAELNPATQQDKIMRLSAELSNHADAHADVLTPEQAFSMHNAASKTAKGIAAIKVVAPTFNVAGVYDTGIPIPFRAAETQHLDVTNPKEAQELLQRREANIAAMKKMQVSLRYQNQQEARAAAAKAAGQINDDQEDTWNNTVADLTSKFEKGLITEDAMQFQMRAIPGLVMSQKPKLPRPNLPTIKNSPPAPLGQIKGAQQAPKPEHVGAIQPGNM